MLSKSGINFIDPVTVFFKHESNFHILVLSDD